MIRVMRRIGAGAAAIAVAISAICCASQPSEIKTVELDPTPTASQGGLKNPMGKPGNKHIQSLVVAGGCFWCVEAVFDELKGVIEAESAYVNSAVPNPSYEQVCTGETGAAEGVKITFDSSVISASDILKLFFVSHNPTTLNQQGPDHGTQYRSAVFFNTPEQKALAEKTIKEIEAEKIWGKKLVTSIEPLNSYYKAEEYHQNYWKKFENATPEVQATMYCNAIIAPKVAKFRAKYRAKLKKADGV